MSDDAPRTVEQRQRDVLALLRAPVLDGWVASAAEEGPAHLVPLSVAWVNDRDLVLCIKPDSPTARNIITHGRTRLGFGPTRDVVMVDADLVESIAVADAPADIAEQFAAQADWDPRNETGYTFLVLRPTRIQAWRSSAEIPGRTVMVRGAWKE